MWKQKSDFSKQRRYRHIYLFLLSPSMITFSQCVFKIFLKVALIYTRQVFDAYLAIAPERRRMKST